MTGGLRRINDDVNRPTAKRRTHNKLYTYVKYVSLEDTGDEWMIMTSDGRVLRCLSLSHSFSLSHSLSLCCLLSVVQFRVYGGFDSGVQYTTMYLSWTTHENIYTYMYYRRWCGVGLSWRDGDDCVWWWWYVDDGRVVVCSVACSHDANLLVECCLWGGGCVSTVEKNEWWFLLKK